MATEKDLADHLETIRKDIASLSETVGQLVSDTAGIQASLKKRVSAAARQATAAGEQIVAEAAEMGNDAMHIAAREASAAVNSVEREIARNPLTAVLIALGAGFAIGLMSRK
jgi:ElaB/YqjD/DUF883 family membrane-anchored ribosome-binding protein